MVYKILAIGGTIIALTYVLTRKTIRPVVLNELAARYSEGCDKLILDEIRQGTLQFISGRLIFTFIPASSKIKVQSELYFQNAQGEWIKKSHEELLNSRNLTKEALTEMQAKGNVTFEIEAPSATEIKGK